MEILNAATDWAKAEVFSTRFFILFGLLFLIGSVGFWQLGKTEIARAYIIPTFTTGLLLLIIGLGLFYTNKSRITQFELAANKDMAAFVKSENERIERTLKEYQTIVFKVIPCIIIACALIIIFMDKAIWRASAISTIAMMAVILLIDGTAHSRIEAYKQHLESLEKTISLDEKN